MDLSLNGLSVIVTGASSGVGLATAKLLLAEGVAVTACARDAARLSAAFADLPGSAVACVPGDVTSREDMERVVALALDRFGRVDGLVCNAGRSLLAPLEETSDDQLREEFELKIFGVWNLVRAARPALAASPHGAIVTVNAILARQPETRLAATSAARAGLLNLTHTLSRELAPEGVRVNSVCLGLVDTGQWRRRFEAAGDGQDYAAWSAALAADRGIPLGRLGTAAEVAFPIVGLLSPHSSYVTGATVDVGGGIARYL